MAQELELPAYISLEIKALALTLPVWLSPCTSGSTGALRPGRLVIHPLLFARLTASQKARSARGPDPDEGRGAPPLQWLSKPMTLLGRRIRREGASRTGQPVWPSSKLSDRVCQGTGTGSHGECNRVKRRPAPEKILVSFGQHRKRPRWGADGSSVRGKASARHGDSVALPFRATAEWQFTCS